MTTLETQLYKALKELAYRYDSYNKQSAEALQAYEKQKEREDNPSPHY